MIIRALAPQRPLREWVGIAQFTPRPVYRHTPIGHLNRVLTIYSEKRGVPGEAWNEKRITPQLPFKRLQIPPNKDHKALDRGTLGGLGIYIQRLKFNPFLGSIL